MDASEIVINFVYFSIFQIYDKYSELIVKLPSDVLDKLTTPTEWNGSNFKKALIVRSKAALAQKPFTTSSNPWIWMNLLINCVVDCSIPDT